MIIWGKGGTWYVGYIYRFQNPHDVSPNGTTWDHVFEFYGDGAAAKAAALCSFLNGNSFSNGRIAEQLIKGEL